MNPRVSLPCAARSKWRPSLLVMLLASALAGCSQPQIRSQKEDESEKDRYSVKTVGDVSTIGNAEPVSVSGVGFVEGLEGTGCPAPVGEARQIIEAELHKAKVENVREILASNDCAIVLVQGLLPAGVKKGDHIDVEVTLPPGSKATSLRGGYLRRCVLHNFAYAGSLSPRFANSGATVNGSPVVRAEGALVVGVSGGPEDSSMKRGRIWSGGVSLIDRQFHIVLNSKNQFSRVSANVANRVNTAFQGSVTMTPGNEVAVAKTSSVVQIKVPAQYKLNLQRFLRVVRMVPLEESSPSKKGPPRLPYREQVREDLLDPARTVVAALRLEGLGTDSIPALKRGLESPHPLVRFCSAEALAYLGSPRCGDELATVVQQQPYLRAFALTAMASLDEAVCHVKLKELMSADLDDESRYGAFRALRALDETDQAVRGEHLGEEGRETFWLHRVPTEGKPFVHVSTSRRAEIVLFGKEMKLVPPFTLVAGDFALTAAEGDPRCTISHVDLHNARDGGTSRERYPLDLPTVIAVLAKQGATYPEVIEVLRQADTCKNLTCRVRNDALPQAVTVEQLALAGRADKLKEKTGHKDGEEESDTEVQLIKPDANFGTTPTLYQKGTGRRK